VTRTILSLGLLVLAGCEPLAISLVGAGAGTALRYGFDGVAYRTFTAPAPDVRQASLAALEQMGMRFESTDTFEGGEVLYARSAKRTIEIEVEPISARATRVRIAARNGGLFYDNATASEIVAQTERLLQSAAQGRSF
jgi:hypothetical protein